MFRKIIVGMIGVSLVLGLIPKMVRADLDTMQILKEYVGPCAIAIGISSVLVKNDGAAVGGAICAGVAAGELLANKPVTQKDLDMHIQKAVDKAEDDHDMKVSAETDEKLNKALDAQSVRFDEMKLVIKEVLSDRISKMEDEIRGEIMKKIESPDFLPELQRKIDERIKTEVITENQARSREVVEKCVDEAVHQIIVNKPIAVPKE